jgi:hypothetical protein
VRPCHCCGRHNASAFFQRYFTPTSRRGILLPLSDRYHGFLLVSARIRPLRGNAARTRGVKKSFFSNEGMKKTNSLKCFLFARKNEYFEKSRGGFDCPGVARPLLMRAEAFAEASTHLREERSSKEYYPLNTCLG